MEVAEERLAQETYKRGRGNPNMKPGVSSVNPSGEPKAVDREELESFREHVAELAQRERVREAAALEAESGGVTSSRMWKVMGQDPVMDVGPTERRLRDWLVKDVKGFESRARELQAEEEGVAELKSEVEILRAERAERERREAERVAEKVEARDAGSERALAMLHTILGVPNGGEE
jgi:hypothetical protein